MALQSHKFAKSVHTKRVDYTSKVSNSSVRDLHPPKPPIIKKVIWSPPFANRIKCNTDGASTSSTSACGGIFRNNNANFLACFADILDGGSTFHSEIPTVIRAIEIASQRRWRNLWIETDSSLVIMALNAKSRVPCNLRNKWQNCMLMLPEMNYVVTHIHNKKCSVDKIEFHMMYLIICQIGYVFSPNKSATMLQIDW